MYYLAGERNKKKIYFFFFNISSLLPQYEVHTDNPVLEKSFILNSSVYSPNLNQDQARISRSPNYIIFLLIF